MLTACVYQEPSSLYISAFAAAAFIALLYLGISEATGKHLQYSKFWNVTSKKSEQILLSSKNGMLLIYTPAFLAGISSFIIYPNGGRRFLMLKSAVTAHFLKRVLEVLFLHKFSGFIVLDSAIVISLLYLTAAGSMTYFQNLTQGMPEPLIDLKHLGLVLFLVGICGNFYHHYLLAKLRGKSDKGYKIPRGGLFSFVICPHYLFEILTFVGVAFISQTLFSYSCALGVVVYLAGRSYSTRKWYLSKFENFPVNVRALIPYVF